MSGSGGLEAGTAISFDRRRQFQAKRQLVLREAARLFNEKGFAQASLDEVADRLGITKPALYHYFRSKDEILFECYQHAFDAADAALAEAHREGRSGLEKMATFLRTYLLGGLGSAWHVLPLRDQKLLADDFRLRLDERRRGRRDKLRDIISEGVIDGSIRPCNPKLIVSAWAGTVAWVIESFRNDGEWLVADVTEELVTLFVRGLAPR